MSDSWAWDGDDINDYADDTMVDLGGGMIVPLSELLEENDND